MWRWGGGKKSTKQSSVPFWQLDRGILPVRMIRNKPVRSRTSPETQCRGEEMLHTPVLHRVHRVAQRKTHFLAVSLCLWRVPNEKDKTFKKNKTESPLKLMARHASALFPHHQSPKGSYCERDPGAQWRTTCNIPHVNRYERHSKQNKHPNKVQRPIPEETHSSPAGYDK